MIRTKDGFYIKFEDDPDIVTQLELLNLFTKMGFWHYQSDIFDRLRSEEVKSLAFNTYVWLGDHE